MFDCQTANAPPPAFAAASAGKPAIARVAAPGLPAVARWREGGGAERRQALVRIRRTRGPPRGRAHLRIAGDDGRIAGRCASRRPAAALGRSLSAFASASGRACVSRCHSGRQRAPRTGVIVPPGRVPEPPGCPADEAKPAGAAQANDAFVIRPGTACLISGCASRLLHQTSVTGWRLSGT